MASTFTVDRPARYLTRPTRYNSGMTDINELARRLRMLEGRGVLVAGSERADRLRPIARKPGALKRFLEERGD